jgi:hypothetical protein
MDNNDIPPMICVVAPNGTIWSPRFHKNTKGEWELNDKSFRKMLRPHSTSEKPTKKMDKD